MSGWIKYEKDLETDPRFLRMLRTLRHADVTQQSLPGVTPPLDHAQRVSLVCGALIRFWSYADTHLRAKDRLDLGPADIDALVGVPDFCVAMPEDWLVIIDDDTVELPDYQRHNGVEARKRDLAQKRQETKRRRDTTTPVTQVRDESVTPVLPDQTRPDQTKREMGERGGTPPAPRKRAKANGQSRPSRKCPEDFVPDLALARSRIPDIDAEREAERFKRHEFRRAHKDWPGTWLNWIDTCADTGRYAKNNQGKGDPYAGAI